MNLDDIHLADISEMPVRHPTTGEPLVMADGQPMVLRLAGQDSPQYRRELAAFQARLAKQRKPRAAPADLEEHTIRALVACTVGWRLEGAEGELPYSPEAARTLYEGKRWLREQADEWVADRANYLGESSPA